MGTPYITEDEIAVLLRETVQKCVGEKLGMNMIALVKSHLETVLREIAHADRAFQFLATAPVMVAQSPADPNRLMIAIGQEEVDKLRNELSQYPKGIVKG